MPNIKKSRRIVRFPQVSCFMPVEAEAQDADPIVLKVEEVEALRLKDVEKLDQETCAQEMQVSRQTFQNILDEAHGKVAVALSEGYPIKILGGDYTMPMCRFLCLDCKTEYDIRYAKDRQFCPSCGSERVFCKKKAAMCQNWCDETGKANT